MGKKARIAILGTGNIGRAMAVGLADAGRFRAGEMILTRRRLDALADLAERGFQVQADNRDAVRRAGVIVLAVQPGSSTAHEGNRRSPRRERHVLISVVSGAAIDDIVRLAGRDVPVVRAMPNTAIAVSASMTCLAVNSKRPDVLETACSDLRLGGRHRGHRRGTHDPGHRAVRVRDRVLPARGSRREPGRDRDRVPPGASDRDGDADGARRRLARAAARESPGGGDRRRDNAEGAGPSPA